MCYGPLLSWTLCIWTKFVCPIACNYLRVRCLCFFGPKRYQPCFLPQFLLCACGYLRLQSPSLSRVCSRPVRFLFLIVILAFNPLNAELNPICHLLALLGADHILHVSRVRVNGRSGRHCPIKCASFSSKREDNRHLLSVAIWNWAPASAETCCIESCMLEAKKEHPKLEIIVGNEDSNDIEICQNC
jgi:hypothetical protein